MSIISQYERFVNGFWEIIFAMGSIIIWKTTEKVKYFIASAIS